MLENLLKVFKFCRILQKDIVQETFGSLQFTLSFLSNHFNNEVAETSAAYRETGRQLYTHSKEIPKNDWGALVEPQPVDVSRWL